MLEYSKDQSIISIGSANVPYERVEGSDSLSDESVIDIPVDDALDLSEVEEKLQKALVEKYWFLDLSFQSEELNEKYRVVLDESVSVEIYNFQQQPLGDDKLNEIGETLQRLYASMKDLSLWRLQSVQILPNDIPNITGGEMTLAEAYYLQERIELFPATFKDGFFHDTLNCTRLQGAISHDATHICLEHALQKQWVANYKELGWVDLDDEVRRNSGSIARWP